MGNISSAPIDTSPSIVDGRVVDDPIHGIIVLDELLCRFVDTPAFQRLKHIHQLGMTYMNRSRVGRFANGIGAGPISDKLAELLMGSRDGSYSRFEHSIGVCHLGGELALHLQRSQPELCITDADVRCVALAGLCHDLGHGPWSHMWDMFFIRLVDPSREHRHEDRSVRIFESIVSTFGIELSRDDCQLVTALILGEPERCPAGRIQGKGFLFDIVANDRNGLDVDRFDYLCRDSFNLGRPAPVNLQRLVKSARVIDDQICYDIEDISEVFKVYSSRFKLFTDVCNDPATKAMEHMVADMLMAADPTLHLSQATNDPMAFLELDDRLLEKVLVSSNEQLKDAQALATRIKTYNLYRVVGERMVSRDDAEEFRKAITPDTLLTEVQALAQLPLELSEDNLIIDFFDVHYGNKNRNPLERVWFYSKDRPNESREAAKAEHDILDIPARFAFVLVRVYTKKPSTEAILRKAFENVVSRIRHGEPETMVPESIWDRWWQTALDFVFRISRSALGIQGQYVAVTTGDDRRQQRRQSTERLANGVPLLALD